MEFIKTKYNNYQAKKREIAFVKGAWPSISPVEVKPKSSIIDWCSKFKGKL